MQVQAAYTNTLNTCLLASASTCTVTYAEIESGPSVYKSLSDAVSVKLPDLLGIRGREYYYYTVQGCI